MSAPQTRRYVIIGAGAVGVGLAAGLADAGIAVLLVSRGRTYEHIRNHGLRFEQNGTVRHLELPVVGSPDDADLQPGDILVLATKSQDAPAALADWAWRPVAGGGVAADLPVLLTQNGLDAERVALRYFDTVIGAVALVAARHLNTGEIEILNAPRIGQIIVGAYPSATLAPHAAEVASQVVADLDAGNWSVQATEEIQRWLAWKITANTTFAISVLAGTPAESDLLRDHIVAEARSVMTAAGLQIAEPDELTLDPEQSRVRATATITEHKPSTWQSFARGSGSEVDYLNGEIALLARQAGVPAPYNSALQHILGRSAALGEAPETHSVDEVLDRAEGRLKEAS